MSFRSQRNIAIIGGGINGFCSGVKILNHGFENVTIISEEFTPNTTGDGSAGLWGPYLCGSTPEEKILKWSKDSHDFFKSLWLSEDCADSGITLLPVYRLTQDPKNSWEDITYGCRNMNAKELENYSQLLGRVLSSGVQFITFTAEPTKLLPYLMERFKKLGGKVVQQKIRSINEFVSNSEYDIVINCTGLSALNNCNDKEVYPIRGQVARVKASWQFHSFLDEAPEGCYIIPNHEDIVLGGTSQKNDFNRNISFANKESIHTKCFKIEPGLRHANHVRDWVGLRPGRSSVRLESEILDCGKILIHNYGHGGCGVTMAWGCATDVLQILINKTQSKL